MRTHALHSLTPFVISTDGVVTPAPPYSAAPALAPYSSLLPDYEEAVKQTPPPSYRAATLAAPAAPALPPTPDEDTAPAQTATVVAAAVSYYILHLIM